MARQDQNSNDLVCSRARYILIPALRTHADGRHKPIGANLRLSLGLSKPYPSYVDGPLARPVLHFDRHWQLLSYVRPVGAAHCPLALMTFDDLGPNHDGGLEAHDG
jgi:hypothetical protein